jgi:hypothetical protein
MRHTIDAMRYIDSVECRNESLSHWAVGQHIHHILIVANGIIQNLQDSKIGSGKERLSLVKFLSLTFSYIPRGKAKSPERVMPSDNITQEIVREAYAVFEKKMPIVNTLPRDSWFNHPVFGDLRRDNALRFIEVHSKHHIKIIRDILA